MNTNALALHGIALPVSVLFVGSVVIFLKRRSLASSLQLIGSAGLVVVVQTHFAEVFELMPWMRWGLEASAGHYLDLGSAVLGLTLFPIGYLAHAFAR
jgi:hypothetical protein